MHDQLVGVPPSDAVLASMEAAITGGNPLGAANIAMADPVFYKSALKNWVAPWTNVPGNVFVDLNDYTATIIGMVRDDVPFNTVLSADLVYTGAPGVVAAAYSQTDNMHYQQLEQMDVDLSDPNKFVGRPQSTLPGAVLNAGETAGIVTTRAAS